LVKSSIFDIYLGDHAKMLDNAQTDLPP